MTRRQILDETLAEQQPVEGIACRRQGLDFGKDVRSLDVQQRETKTRNSVRQLSERPTKRKLAQPDLDRDLPQAGDAGVEM